MPNLKPEDRSNYNVVHHELRGSLSQGYLPYQVKYACSINDLWVGRTVVCLHLTFFLLPLGKDENRLIQFNLKCFVFHSGAKIVRDHGSS